MEGAIAVASSAFMRWLLVLVLVALPASAQPMVLEGDLPTDGPAFVLVPFEVPAGTAEIEVRHPVQQSENILDYGLHDPSGTFRGWGGGNSEPIVVGAQASSRSYLTGPIAAGTWNVVIGKAKVVTSPARYRLEIELRTAPTLAAQPERRPYAPAAALSADARWYAGDFHVHSKESGDAHPTLDEIGTFARGRGLDFVELSDHNTTAQLDFMGDAQARHPQLLFVPGVEFTTYDGHANGIGATAYVDHRFGVGGATFDGAVAAFGAQGAVFSINHPVLDLGLTCIGCAWKQPIPRDALGAVEIGTGGWDKTGLLFTKQAIAFWDRLVGQGVHAAPVGGSDDHSGGTGTGQFDSAIGSPTTMVFATELSAAGIVDAVKAGRTVVKLQGPEDPMVDLVPTAVALDTGDARVTTLIGGHFTGPAVALEVGVKVTGGQGATLKLVQDGAEVSSEPITADPFTARTTVTIPETGERRLRAEVWVDGQPRTVSGHVFFSLKAEAPKGCGCSSPGPAVLGLLALGLGLRRRRH